MAEESEIEKKYEKEISVLVEKQNQIENDRENLCTVCGRQRKGNKAQADMRRLRRGAFPAGQQGNETNAYRSARDSDCT